MQELNNQSFKQKVIDSKELVLVDFSATWCGPCQMQKPVLEDLENKVDFKIYSVDIDENQDLAASYNVNAVPTLMVFFNGSLKKSLAGFHSAEAIEKAVEEYK
ncbi:MAG: thioredoxin [Tissierellia bacterium]|nr:thioredoxin [Tissierellia bacterium]